MASGDTLATYGALDGIPPASNFALQDLRNNHPILDFDAATEWIIYVEDVLPRHYSGNGITVTLWWMAATATTGDVVWGVSVERHQAGVDDLDADSFATEQTATTTTSGTSGVLATTAIPITNGANMDNLAPGESFRLRFARKAAASGDTMAGNAQLLNVEVKET